MITETGLLTARYYRQLIESGVSAQGNDAQVIAEAIARRDTQFIPPNPMQQQIIRSWRILIERADLWRSDLLEGAIAP